MRGVRGEIGLALERDGEPEDRGERRPQAVSHDLRTPLAAILGLAVTLESQADLASDTAHDLASRISMNARKLDRIV